MLDCAGLRPFVHVRAGRWAGGTFSPHPIVNVLVVIKPFLNVSVFLLLPLFGVLSGFLAPDKFLVVEIGMVVTHSVLLQYLLLLVFFLSAVLFLSTVHFLSSVLLLPIVLFLLVVLFLSLILPLFVFLLLWLAMPSNHRLRRIYDPTDLLFRRLWEIKIYILSTYLAARAMMSWAANPPQPKPSRTRRRVEATVTWRTSCSIQWSDADPRNYDTLSTMSYRTLSCSYPFTCDCQRMIYRTTMKMIENKLVICTLNKDWLFQSLYHFEPVWIDLSNPVELIEWFDHARTTTALRTTSNLEQRHDIIRRQNSEAR